MANYVNFPRLAAGEAATVTFSVDEDVSGWHFSVRYGAERGAVPLVQKTTGGTAPNGVTITGTSATSSSGYWILTATDTGRTLGPGLWPVELWRTDSGFEARVAWGEQPLYKVVGPLPG